MGTIMNPGWSLISTVTLAMATTAFVAPGHAQSMASDPLVRARSNCLASIARVVGLPSSHLKVIDQTLEASGISIAIQVPNASAPWACRTDLQGQVEDVHFTGSEGAL